MYYNQKKCHAATNPSTAVPPSDFSQAQHFVLRPGMLCYPSLHTTTHTCGLCRVCVVFTCWLLASSGMRFGWGLPLNQFQCQHPIVARPIRRHPHATTLERPAMAGKHYCRQYWTGYFLSIKLWCGSTYGYAFYRQESISQDSFQGSLHKSVNWLLRHYFLMAFSSKTGRRIFI